MTSISIPKGYKQTEVGVIPVEWEVKTLGQLISLAQYGSSAKSSSSGKVPVLRMGNLQGGTIDWDSLVYTNNEQEIAHYELNRDDLLFNRTNTIDLVGKTSIFKAERQAIYAGYLIRVVVHKGLVCPDFVNYFMNTPTAKRYSQMVLSVAVGQANINAEKLKTYPIPLPPLAEQKAIAQVLSDTDALIASLDKLISKKKAIKQGTMQELLTGRRRIGKECKTQSEKCKVGADGIPEGYKQTEVGVIPEEWEVNNIGSFCRTYSGGTPPTSVDEYYGGEIPWITSSDLNQSIILDVSGRITKLGLSNSSAKMVNSETLLLALYGATAGVSAITKITAAINQAVLAILPQSGLTHYLYYFLQLRKDFIIDTYTQGGQPNLSADIVKSILIPLPPLAEQKAISQVLSDMDSEIAELEARRDKSKALKQGLMQVLLTGKVRLG